MERETKFVSVILPVAIPKVLTYRVPFEMNDFVQVGCRVVVRLGKAKLYTGLILQVSQTPPEYPAKYVEVILDDQPIVTPRQLQFWQWMSDYYMCTLGEIFSAALPSSLRMASETKVMLNDEWDGDTEGLNDKAFLVVEALQVQDLLSLKEIAEILEVKFAQPIVKKLVERQILITEEELKQKYKPKKLDFIKLTAWATTEENLKEIIETTERRAPKQLQAIMAYLQMSGWDRGENHEVAKLKLQKANEIDSATVSALVKKNVFEIYSKSIARLADVGEARKPLHPLNEEQAKAFISIKEHFETKDIVLLHGVTSSGKTEVYAQLISEALERGEQVLFLLPEIALTTQLVNRLIQFFGNQVGVYHSRFNQNERVEIWNNVLANKKRSGLVVGARSTIFLPFTNLGLIVVDEEHDASYKQTQPAPYYNARDMALVLAKLHKAKVVMGSATPAVETYWNASQGNFGLVEMTKRFGGVQLPEIWCADLKKELNQKTMHGIFSNLLLEGMKEVLKEKKQIILFQNRRGFTPQWRCQKCFEVPSCERCDVKLTYHKHIHTLKCHYCGYAKSPPKECENCGSHEIKMVGFGTEKIEEELGLLIPEIKIQRMDLDTTRSKNAYQNIINSFENREIDVLVGTQMVTKGLDFDNVGLVGVLDADRMLNFPDFRSMERSYQLLAQVSGRAGRSGDRGKVIIQTHTPTHWILQKVMYNDYESMYKQELLEREQYLYPPFWRLIQITFKHKEERRVGDAAQWFAEKLRVKFGVRVLGPEAPFISRINLQYIRTIMLKFERDASTVAVKKELLAYLKEFYTQEGIKSVRVQMDVDPM